MRALLEVPFFAGACMQLDQEGNEIFETILASTYSKWRRWLDSNNVKH